MINKLQIIILCILIPVGLLYWYTYHKNVSIRDFFFSDVQIMQVGDTALKVEIANSDEERTKGLSNRPGLASTQGLLFVFPETGYPSMWMKDMQFSIDIIWISEDLKVIGIEKELSPETYPRVYRPERPARYVLEINEGYAETYAIHEGQTVRLPVGYLDD